MKTLHNFINEGKLTNKLSSDDKKNFKIIADELSLIVTEIDEWMQADDKNEDSETGAFAHLLSLLASQLRGEVNEEVSFNFGK